MKRTNNLYRQIISFENVLKAANKARRGKRYRYSTAMFELHLEKNIFRIIDVLEKKIYKPGPYKEFFIYDPKTRLICAATYFDRVIHHALINVIEPILGGSFIYDTYACIKGQGTHKAVQRYKQFQAKNQYVLKCDIKKYFPNIDHVILFDKLKRKIKCRDTLWLIKEIIDSYHSRQEIEHCPEGNVFASTNRKRGIPIGNLTSQFFANLYLNDFDHFIKEIMRVKYYIRYCDDFVIFWNNKKELNNFKTIIQKYLATLGLELHTNKSRVYKTADGVDFLGYRIFPDYLRVRKSVVKRYRRKLEKMRLGYKSEKISLPEIHSSIQSWIGHVKHADSYNLRCRLFSNAVFSKS